MCSRKLQQFTLYIQGTDIAETTHREVLQLNYQRKTWEHLGCACSQTVAKNLSLSKPVLSHLYTSKAILHRFSDTHNHKIACKKLSFQNTFQTVQVPGCSTTSSKILNFSSSLRRGRMLLYNYSLVEVMPALQDNKQHLLKAIKSVRYSMLDIISEQNLPNHFNLSF